MRNYKYGQLEGKDLIDALIHAYLDNNFFDEDVTGGKRDSLYSWTVCDVGTSGKEKFKDWIRREFKYPDFNMEFFNVLAISEIVDNIYNFQQSIKKEEDNMVKNKLNKHLEFVFNRRWTNVDNSENTLHFWLLGETIKKPLMHDLKLFIRDEFQVPYFDMLFTNDTTIDSIVKEIEREQARMKEFEDLNISDVSAAADKFDEVTQEAQEERDTKMKEYQLINSINLAFLDWNDVGNYRFDLKGVEITTTGYNEDEITSNDSALLVTIYSNNKEIVQYAVSNLLSDTELSKVISYEIFVENHQVLFDILHFIKVKILNRFKSDIQHCLNQLTRLEDKNYKLSSEIFIKELEIMTLRKEQIEIQGNVHKINKEVSALNAAMLDYHEKNFL